MSLNLIPSTRTGVVARAVPSGQLIKWVGSKHRHVEDLTSYFPLRYGKYIEPFLGSGAVLGALNSEAAYGSDIFDPLIQIWQTVKKTPNTAFEWYRDRYNLMFEIGKFNAYQKILKSYNENNNPKDLLFLVRSCYGGIVRFRKKDGYMSTPVGVHDPIKPESFRVRLWDWTARLQNTQIECHDYKNAFKIAQPGDLIYCNPPYLDSQKILYGAQDFNIYDLYEEIGKAKKRGVFVALSIDGKKKSGSKSIDINLPKAVFEREVMLNCGGSMLKRFQVRGGSVESEIVHDRLLLTY